MKLSLEQENALVAFRQNKNILLTGPGGTGKTALIKEMVEIGLKQNKEVQVCALTCCAAVLLKCDGAKTVHSWAGIGLASGPSKNVIERVSTNKNKRGNWSKVDILIIDEISMMSKKLFDILDSIGRIVKKKLIVPFGGIQVVFSGDFYQLPPVGDPDEEETTQFCFESDRWSESIDEIIQLTTIFRQTDTEYSKILSQIRVGKLYKSSYEKLLSRVNQPYPENGIKPTILLPRRKDVDNINTNELLKLESQNIEFIMKSIQDESVKSDKDKYKVKFTDEYREFETKSLM